MCARRRRTGEGPGPPAAGADRVSCENSARHSEAGSSSWRKPGMAAGSVSAALGLALLWRLESASRHKSPVRREGLGFLAHDRFTQYRNQRRRRARSRPDLSGRLVVAPSRRGGAAPVPTSLGEGVACRLPLMRSTRVAWWIVPLLLTRARARRRTLPRSARVLRGVAVVPGRIAARGGPAVARVWSPVVPRRRRVVPTWGAAPLATVPWYRGGGGRAALSAHACGALG